MILGENRFTQTDYNNSVHNLMTNLLLKKPVFFQDNCYLEDLNKITILGKGNYPIIQKSF